jgi:hypothetical protein
VSPPPDRFSDASDAYDFPRDDESTDVPAPPLADDAPRYYMGVIERVYYGSESGILASEATGRRYQFRMPFVEIVGTIPKVSGLREGMRVGFDLAWTSRGVRINVIRVFD